MAAISCLIFSIICLVFAWGIMLYRISRYAELDKFSIANISITKVGITFLCIFYIIWVVASYFGFNVTKYGIDKYAYSIAVGISIVVLKSSVDKNKEIIQAFFVFICFSLLAGLIRKLGLIDILNIAVGSLDALNAFFTSIAISAVIWFLQLVVGKYIKL